MTSKVAELLAKQVQQQCGKWLKDFPEERNGSIGFVYKHLLPVHADAAIWMDKHHGMELDTNNLHNLIAHFGEMRALATMLPCGAIVNFAMDVPPNPGEFHPAHLVEYFIWLDSGCPDPAPQYGFPADHLH